MGVDPQVQALLWWLPGICSQEEQAREDATEPERQSWDSTSPGHCGSVVLLASGATPDAETQPALVKFSGFFFFFLFWLQLAGLELFSLKTAGCASLRSPVGVSLGRAGGGSKEGVDARPR